MFRYLGLLAAVILLASFSGQANAAYMGYSFGGYSYRESPEVNRILSARYDHLLQISPRFRAHRIWKECRPVNLPELHTDCVTSFDQYEPVAWRY
jgi:hypothetical protein